MSPRPKKPRNCQCPFVGHAFKPTGIPMTEIEKVALGREELEAIRLCDLEGDSQEHAGEKMGVSRGTIQRTVTQARKKVAYALTNKCALVFEKNEFI